MLMMLLLLWIWIVVFIIRTLHNRDERRICVVLKRRHNAGTCSFLNRALTLRQLGCRTCTMLLTATSFLLIMNQLLVLVVSLVCGAWGSSSYGRWRASPSWTIHHSETCVVLMTVSSLLIFLCLTFWWNISYNGLCHSLLRFLARSLPCGYETFTLSTSHIKKGSASLDAITVLLVTICWLWASFRTSRCRYCAEISVCSGRSINMLRMRRRCWLTLILIDEWLLVLLLLIGSLIIIPWTQKLTNASIASVVRPGRRCSFTSRRFKGRGLSIVSCGGFLTSNWCN